MTGIIAASYQRYDEDFHTNVLDVAAVNGFAIPARPERAKLNRLMASLKRIGLYERLDTFVNFAHNDLGMDQFSLIDWKRTGMLYTAHGGMVYEANGWHGNAANAFVSTNFVPDSNGQRYTLNNAGRGIVVYDTGVLIERLDGTLVTGQLNNLAALVSVALRINSNNANLETPFDMSGTGLKGINRDNGTDIRLLNKAYQETRAVDSNILPTNPQLLFGGGSGYGDTGISSYYMGASVPFNMMQDYRTVYNDYLSRQGLIPFA